MANTISYTFKLDGANKTVKDIEGLEKTLESLRGQIKNVELGSDAFKELQTEIRKADSALKNLDVALEGVDTAKLAGSFAKLGEGIGGGFAIATNALGALGLESSNVAQAEIRAQQAIAIVMGARAIAEGVVEGASAARLIVDKLTSIQTKINIGLFGADKVAKVTNAAATEGATIAQKALNLAMKSNPIILIISALIALIAAVAAFSGGTKDAETNQLALNAAMLSEIELSKTLNKNLSDKRQTEIELAIIQKKSSAEIYQLKLNDLNITKQQAQAELDKLANAIENGKQILKNTSAESDNYEKLREQQDSLIAAQKSASQTRADVQKQSLLLSATELQKHLDFELENEQKRLDKSKETNKKILEDRKKSLDDIRQALKDNQIQIDDLNDITEQQKLDRSKQRELDSAKTKYDELISLSKGNDSAKLAADKAYFDLKSSISTEYTIKQQLLDDKAKEDADKLAADQSIKDSENFIASADSKSALELAKLGNDNIAKLEYQRLNLESQLALELELAEKTGSDKQLIYDKYATAEIELEKSIVDAKKAERQKDFDNTIQGAQAISSSLQSISDTIFAYQLKNAKGNAAEEKKIRKKQFDVNKAFGIANAVIDGIQSVQKALNNPYPLNIVLAAASGVMAVANVAKIASTKFDDGGGSGGGGGGGSINGTVPIGDVSNSAQSSMFKAETVGANGSSDGKSNDPNKRMINNEPQKVYVLESDISKTQKRVSVIEQNASVG